MLIGDYVKIINSRAFFKGRIGIISSFDSINYDMYYVQLDIGIFLFSKFQLQPIDLSIFQDLGD